MTPPGPSAKVYDLLERIYEQEISVRANGGELVVHHEDLVWYGGTRQQAAVLNANGLLTRIAGEGGSRYMLTRKGRQHAATVEPRLQPHQRAALASLREVSSAHGTGGRPAWVEADLVRRHLEHEHDDLAGRFTSVGVGRILAGLVKLHLAQSQWEGYMNRYRAR